jgi:hypothetical protein
MKIQNDSQVDSDALQLEQMQQLLLQLLDCNQSMIATAL